MTQVQAREERFTRIFPQDSVRESKKARIAMIRAQSSEPGLSPRQGENHALAATNSG